jgi:hypothetical protein
MADKNKDPIKSHQPTMCAVCAWRVDCKKKYSYEQGSVIKCPDFTRDQALPEPHEADK